MRVWRYASIILLLVGVSYSIYVGFLFKQLVDSFTTQKEFIPTRIYSDVTRIASPQKRRYVQSRLKDLGYIHHDISENRISFTLHDADYPHHLIPESHVTSRLVGQEIQLQFDGNQEESILESIFIPAANQELQEISDLFLEPELITRLSRDSGTGEAEKKVREFVRFEDFPATIWKAIIAIEDQHFLEHKGLDPRGFARAIWINLKTLSFAQGGSTITQQLVKNLMVRRSKNLFKKLTEIFLSILLEFKYGKKQILERYLNEVYLGQIGNLEVHGVQEGANYFFGKKIQDLNLGEITLLAGIIRGPYYYSPYRHMNRAVERQQMVLQKMVETGQITQEEALLAINQPIRLAPPTTGGNKAPYFTDFVKARLIEKLKDRLSESELSDAGLRVYTTLDPYLNQEAQDTLKAQIQKIRTQSKVLLPFQRNIDGAIASVDHQMGQIRVLIGGSDYQESTFNRILNMKRQVGSTFKPVVYLSAFLKEDPSGKRYGPAYPLEDHPWKLIYDGGNQNWEPKNYTPEYLGWIPARKALILSKNIPTARLGMEIGLDQIIETAKKLGIQSPLPRVPSLTLGVTELSPVELLRVYTAFSNRGSVARQLLVIRAITLEDGTDYARFFYEPQQVISPAAADLMTNLLRDVFTEGTARSAYRMGFDYPAAGKTGTTSDHRDSWFAGFTPRLTTVTWVGIDQGDTLDQKTADTFRLTGAGTALPVWVGFMKKTFDIFPPEPFPISEELVDVPIDRHTGNTAKINCSESQILVEKYMKGYKPEISSCESNWPESQPKTDLSQPEDPTV